MKKWVSVLLLVTTALCVVAGCGGNDKKDAEPLVVAMNWRIRRLKQKMMQGTLPV